MASITPSCIVNGSKTFCNTKLSNCLTHQSSFNMNDGLLATTSHSVHSIGKNGTESQLFSNGSLYYVHWHRLSRIEVRGKGSSINKTFYPPNSNLGGKSDVFPIDMHFDEIQYEWMDIFQANHSIQNEIIRKTNKQIDLIKKDVIAKKTHLTLWLSIGFVLVIISGSNNNFLHET